MAADFSNRLEPSMADELQQVGATRTYPARSYIFYEGDPGTGVFLIEDGLVRVDRTTASGRVVLLDLVTRGRVIGELTVIDDEPRSATLSTVTKATVRFIPTEVFRSLMLKTPPLHDAVMRQLARRLRVLSTQFLETSTMDAPARIASRLVRLVEIEQSLGRSLPDANGEIVLKLPISQEELGQWAGLSREGAVKGLGTLRSVGIIETGRKRVDILDLHELRDRAE